MKKLCFVHIPKTAGTTVTKILSRWYQPGEIFPGQTMPDYKQIDKHSLEQYQLYKGHVLLSHARKNFSTDTSYITLLRNPVDRVISLYYFWQSHSDEHIQASKKNNIEIPGPEFAKQYSLQDFITLQEPFVIQATRNAQLFFLKTIAASLNKQEHHEKILRNVRNNLSKFNVVGVQSQLPFFIHEVKHFLNINDPASIPFENKSKNQNEFSLLTPSLQQNIIDTITEHNALEIKIYNELEEKINTRINQQLASLAQLQA